VLIAEKQGIERSTSGGMGENEAYLDRQSGKIYWPAQGSIQALPVRAHALPNPQPAAR
jgi:hypothetical protein